MKKTVRCRILSCKSGLFTAIPQNADGTFSPDDIIAVPPRGNFKHRKIDIVCGDYAYLQYEETPDGIPDASRGILIENIEQEKNRLIRPPVANIDVLFVMMTPKSPEPSTLVTDKILCYSIHNDIMPVVVINKYDLDRDVADRLADIYEKAGFRTFRISSATGEGTDVFRDYLPVILGNGSSVAFAGPSGVGKSTCINMLLNGAGLRTSDISRKTGRGRHTTKEARMIPVSENGRTFFITDTAGFGLLDYESFDLMDEENLVWCFPEFERYITKCKYTKCSHTKEEGCAIIDAVRNGDISASRHESYITIKEELRSKKNYEKSKK